MIHDRVHVQLETPRIDLHHLQLRRVALVRMHRVPLQHPIVPRHLLSVVQLWSTLLRIQTRVPGLDSETPKLVPDLPYKLL